MVTPSAPPVAIYCRISKDAEASGLGVARQEKECRKLAEARGWRNVELYADNDISAYSSSKQRPEYVRLIEDLRARRLAANIAWDPDRLHRSPRELEEFIPLIEASATPVVMVTSGDVDFSTANGRMQARIKGGIARYESEHRSERTVAKHAELAEKGRWKGGPRPYGYDIARDTSGHSLKDGRLVIIEAEAAIVRESAERVLAGESVYSICGDLNCRGVPTAQEKRWRTPTLRRVLTNPTTAGKREYQGEIVGEGLWAPILDEMTWRRLRAMIGHGKATGQRPGRRTYLLTGGLAVCGRCGSNLHAQRRESGSRTYACVGGPDKEGCGRLTCAAEPLDELVSGAVIAALDSPHLAAAMQSQRGGQDDGASDVAALERDLRDLAGMFGAGEISRAEWTAARQGVETRLAAAQREESRSTGALVLAPWVRGAVELLDAWPDLSLDRRRAILAAVLEQVTVRPASRRGPKFDPGRVDLRWSV